MTTSNQLGAMMQQRDAAIAACALMIKGICMTRPQGEWTESIENRIHYLLQHGLPPAAPTQTSEVVTWMMQHRVRVWSVPYVREDDAKAGDMTDAYLGARGDLSIWKKRALEAEALNRKFMAEINGPIHLGEPVVAAQSTQPAEGGEKLPNGASNERAIFSTKVVRKLWELKEHYRVASERPSATVLDGKGGAFEWPPLPELPKHFACHQFDSMYTAHQMQAYANAYGELVRAASPQATATHACWSCKKECSEAQLRDADGNCPHRGVEIEEETPAAVQPDGGRS